MNIKWAIAEGFTVIVVKDIGPPFSSDKYCSECKWCQGIGGVFSKVNGVAITMGHTFVMPVHEHCFEEASNYVKNHTQTQQP